MTTLEVLEKTRDLLSDPARWTQQAGAKDAFGIGITAKHPNARCWCLIGALDKVADDNRAYDYLYFRTEHGVAAFNDNHTHAQVLAFLDTAINDLRAMSPNEEISYDSNGQA